MQAASFEAFDPAQLWEEVSAGVPQARYSLSKIFMDYSMNKIIFLGTEIDQNIAVMFSEIWLYFSHR